MAAAKGRSSFETPLPAQIIMLRRLKLALFGAVIIPALLLVAGAWDGRTQLLQAAESNAVATVTALREHAFKAIESHELLIRGLDRRIQGMSGDEIHASSAALSAEIATMHAGLPEVVGMAITDAEGRRFAGSGPPERDGNVSPADREFWSIRHEADRGTFVSGAYAGSQSGRPVFSISRRRTTADGSFDGTVRVGIAASYFSDFWSEVTSGRSEIVVVLARLDGEVLARFPETDSTPPQTTGEVGLLVQHTQANPRGGVFRAISAPDGVERIFAYSRVGNYPLVVGYGVALSSVVAPWRQHLLDFGGLGVFVTAALVLAVLAAMRQVHRLIVEQARRITIEQAVQKGQPLELLGQLTAGIAHDFANILQAMGAVTTSLKRTAGHPERVCSLADRLEADIERGASLTQRMLNLVRQNNGRGQNQSSGEGDVINLAEAISRVRDVLPRLLGGRYRVRCELPEDWQAFLRGDRSELELVIMNLAVNARDAMPDGGEIIIRAAPERVGETSRNVSDDHHLAGLVPGSYVRISVADSGVGMSPDVLAQVGVPFFTTKAQGRGTGLGLVGARSFAERTGGKLCIDSEEGRGTTVTLWLPAVAPRQASEPRQVEQVSGE